MRVITLNVLCCGAGGDRGNKQPLRVAGTPAHRDPTAPQAQPGPETPHHTPHDPQPNINELDSSFVCRRRLQDRRLSTAHLSRSGDVVVCQDWEREPEAQRWE
ncbi:unnamed protein product [Lota lota]